MNRQLEPDEFQPLDQEVYEHEIEIKLSRNKWIRGVEGIHTFRFDTYREQTLDLVQETKLRGLFT